ncbi:hypothetical protein Fcan01_09736 [Folsomia candida]|uniref:C2H2-type domain-containing protein n=1 Tax=Folsomia candida TaxID=158441 RepID=A0A226EDA4_FOLCA|nr:hypothetical protein Fcan01_09736 [Folsomia candida]
MVAVKMLWVLWKNFSTNFSFSNGNGSADQKRVRYNRLRPQNKSRSHPANLSSNCKKDVNQTSTRGGSSSGGLTTSASYDTNGNKLPGSSASSSSSSSTPATPGSDGGEIETGWRYDFDSDSDYEDDDDAATPQQAVDSGDESSDFDDEDEGLTCDVCDRAFPTSRKLADHQQKKRHFGSALILWDQAQKFHYYELLQSLPAFSAFSTKARRTKNPAKNRTPVGWHCQMQRTTLHHYSYSSYLCDSIFPSSQALSHHREQMDHYDFVSDYGSDTTSFESDEEGFEDEEERERLL